MRQTIKPKRDCIVIRSQAISVRVEHAFKQKIRAAAKAEGLTISEFVDKVLRASLKEN